MAGASSPPHRYGWKCSGAGWDSPALRQELARTPWSVATQCRCSVSKTLRAISLTDPRYTAKLEKLGLRVLRFDYAKTFDDICDQFITPAGENMPES